MRTLILLKNTIPFLFAAIILFFLFSLDADNTYLSQDNKQLRKEVKQINGKNDNLAHTLNTLSERIGEMTVLVKDESRRRAAAEMKTQRLQEEVKDLLKNPRSFVADDTLYRQVR